MKFQGFVGPSYPLKSVNVDCQRCVNLYPEKVESGSGKEGEQYYLKSTPGLELLLTVGLGPIRCIHEDPVGLILIVSGDELYSIEKNLITGVYSATKIGDLETSTGPFRAKSIRFGALYLSTQTVFVGGGTTYLLYNNRESLPFTQTFGTFASFGYPQVDNASHVELLDGYFIYNKRPTNTFFVSNWNNITVNPLSFASSEGDPGAIQGLIRRGRELRLITERTTEVWQDTGNADFPFERIPGGFFEMGAIAPDSIAKIGDSIFWLGRDEKGQGIVYMASGLQPQKISTFAIEYAISQSSLMRLASAFAYQSGGHSFYVLNLDIGTWVYDLSTGQWHERCYTNSGTLERHRANTHQFCQSTEDHIVGDYSNNKVYRFNDSFYMDDTDFITRMRTFPHISASRKILFYNSLDIDMETGVGLNSGQGSDPQVMLDWSNDGGHTWSSESFASLGKQIGGVGNYKARVRWTRLGQSRDRVFRVKITDPVPVTIMNAELDAVAGAS